MNDHISTIHFWLSMRYSIDTVGDNLRVYIHGVAAWGSVLFYYAKLLFCLLYGFGDVLIISANVCANIIRMWDSRLTPLRAPVYLKYS